MWMRMKSCRERNCSLRPEAEQSKVIVVKTGAIYQGRDVDVRYETVLN